MMSSMRGFSEKFEMQQQDALTAFSCAPSYDSSANFQPCSNSINNWKGTTPGTVPDLGVKRGLQGEEKEQNR